MTAPRKQAIRSEMFDKNIDSRGKVPKTLSPKKEFPVGPLVLGLFVFVVIGSAVLSVISTARGKGPPA